MVLHTMNWVASLLAILPIQAATLNGIQYNVDYGADHLDFFADNAVRLRLDTSGNGARVGSAEATFNGQFCAKVITPMARGAILALYASTKSDTTGDRDEITLQFMRNNDVDDGSVQTISFLKGVASPSQRVSIGAAKVSGIPGPAVTYCLSWNIGNSDPALNKAVWSANGAQIRTLSLVGWTRPLRPILSYWSVQNDNPGNTRY